MAAERVLSERALNRAVLARQLLLERGRMSLPRALERVAGLQAQYAPSMYVGLWSRLDGFERDDLTRALEQRSVVQATLMRTTIHLVSPGDFWPFALATRDARRELWLRARPDGPPARELAAAARRLRTALADGPLRRTEIEELLGKELARGVGNWIDLVRVPPRARGSAGVPTCGRSPRPGSDGPRRRRPRELSCSSAATSRPSGPLRVRTLRASPGCRSAR